MKSGQPGAKPGPGPWANLPRGRFTGIDWSAPGALDRSDPYPRGQKPPASPAFATPMAGWHAPIGCRC